MVRIIRAVSLAAGLLLLGAPARASAIHDAAEHGNMKKLMNLIRSNRGLVNAKDDSGRAPLHHAALSGYQKAAVLLLQAGAKPGLQDRRGHTPMHLVCWNSYKRPKEKLEILKMLLACKADPNVKNEYGYTPLFDAVRMASMEFALLLIAHKARVDVKSEKGSTPLHMAASKGKQVVSLLIFKGADVNARNEFGMTPLHNAAMSRHSESGEVARVLLAKRAKIDEKSEKGSTALLLAAKFGNALAAAVLISAKADLNVQDEDGSTPLHWTAADSGSTSTAKGQAVVAAALLKAGANFRIKDKQGRTPFALAQMKGRAEIVKALRAAGAKE